MLHVLQIEWPRVSNIQDARIGTAFDGVWRSIAWQTDVSGSGHGLLLTFSYHVCEVALQPDIDFVAGMTMARYHIFRWAAEQDFGTAFGEIAAKGQKSPFLAQSPRALRAPTGLCRCQRLFGQVQKK